eukprot:GHVU01131775.1.p1 GENE.GHVU01131775.1~~GHVU01131775.1.p1  ORF type:complete len:133 (-),score=6.38 GHVU01131775.1:75-473(-)
MFGSESSQDSETTITSAAALCATYRIYRPTDPFSSPTLTRSNIVLLPDSLFAAPSSSDFSVMYALQSRTSITASFIRAPIAVTFPCLARSAAGCDQTEPRSDELQLLQQTTPSPPVSQRTTVLAVAQRTGPQ